MTDLALAGGGILDDLGINLRVVAVQAFLFIVTFFALKKILFERVLAHMKGRELDAEAQGKRIHEERAEVERLAKDYEARVQQIDKEAYARLQAALTETLEQKGRIVAEAQKKAAEEMKAALEAIAEEKRRALESLRTEVAGLSTQAARQVLEVPVDDAALDAAVRSAVSERTR